MVYGSLLRNPKQEEQEVPHRNDDDDQFEGIDDIMEDLEGFLGIEKDEEEEEEFSELVLSSWDLMDLEFPKEEEFVDIKVNVENVKKENVGFWDIKEEEEKRLCLNLNYQEVLDAWSDRGSLWADQCSLSMASSNNASYMGEVPVMEEERSSRREASVLRYKEKRQNRLFSKKIRYQVRKLNADKRPRLKGRFVKRGGS